MNNLKLSLAVLLTVILLVSCKRDNPANPQQGDSNTNQVFLSFYNPSRILNNSLITLIGIRHNDIMEEAIQEIDWESTDLESELSGFFLNYDDPFIDSALGSRTDIGAVVNNPGTYLLENINPLVYDMIMDCKTYIQGKPSFSNLQAELLLYKGYANSTFTGSDLDASLLFLEVLEKSAYFWMPVTSGGSGIGWGFIEDYCQANEIDVAYIDWGAIAWADGAGAAGVLLRTWYLAAAPLTWGAIVGAIGWGAAWSSGSSLLYQLMF